MASATGAQGATDVLERFKNFDEKFRQEAAAPMPEDFESGIPRLRALIDALPQRGAIRDDNARRWLDRTLSMAVTRMDLEHGEGNFAVADVHQHVMWHIRRASGIGGSEAGTVLKHFRGERGTFSNAHNLVLEKLLVLSPQPSTPEMARGVRAEPWIQKIYQDTTGNRTDEDALALLRGFRWDRAPFLAGTPDDIVILDGGNRRMVDYKAPSADVCADYENKGISFDYVCQLHHYGIISMAAGCRFADMSIEVLDPRSFEVVTYPVPFDREVAKELTASARRLWNEHVMTGVIPDAPVPDELRADDPDLIALAHEAAMFRAMKEMIEKREKEWIERIEILGTDMHEKAIGKMALGVADYNRTRSWNEEALVSLARAADIDPDAFRAEGKKIDAGRAEEILTLLVKELREGGDPSAILEDLSRDGVPLQRPLKTDDLAEALQAAGIDTIEAAGVKASFGLTRKKKGPEAETLGRLRNNVAELVDALDEVVRENAQRIILGEEDPEELPEM